MIGKYKGNKGVLVAQDIETRSPSWSKECLPEMLFARMMFVFVIRAYPKTTRERRLAGNGPDARKNDEAYWREIH